MPKRTDIRKILLIGSGPIVIGQACEFDYSGTQAVKALREEGFEVVLVNSNPATIMTDPEMARPHLRRAAHAGVRGPGHRARAARRAPADGGRPDRAQPRRGAGRGRHARALRRRADRGQAPRHQDGGGPEALRRGHDAHRPRDAAGLLRPRAPRTRSRACGSARMQFPLILRPSFTLGGTGGSIAYNPEELDAADQVGAPAEPGAAGARRGVGDRLEGVRAGGDARPRRQRRHHLLHRELRPDGRAHRRLHHGGAGADADRQGIPADARRRARDHPRDRRGDGRLQHPVRRGSRPTGAWSSSR